MCTCMRKERTFDSLLQTTTILVENHKNIKKNYRFKQIGHVLCPKPTREL